MSHDFRSNSLAVVDFLQFLHGIRAMKDYRENLFRIFSQINFDLQSFWCIFSSKQEKCLSMDRDPNMHWKACIILCLERQDGSFPGWKWSMGIYTN